MLTCLYIMGHENNMLSHCPQFDCIPILVDGRHLYTRDLRIPMACDDGHKPAPCNLIPT